MIHGTVKNDPEVQGFYAGRWIISLNEDRAQRTMFRRLRKEYAGSLGIGDLEVEEAQIISLPEARRSPNKGATFY